MGKGIRTGYAFDFGNYPQGRFLAAEERKRMKEGTEAADEFPVKPIRWQVLEVRPDEGIALIVTKQALAGRTFHAQGAYPGWEKSDMRAWLNGEFFAQAFNEAEKELVQAVTVRNDASEDCRGSRSGGADTEDRVFLLSSREARDYFADSVARRCTLSALAKSQGAYSDDEGDCCWWLRSPGEYEDNCTFVSYGGSYSYDKPVYMKGFAVRPALWVKYAALVKQA